MATTLATMRSGIATTIAGVSGVQVYRRRQSDPQYPCLVIGWPEEFDVRPDNGDERDATIPVWVGVEVRDGDGADDQLSTLLDATVAILLTVNAYDVAPVSDFGEQLLQDDRIVVWAKIPVSVLA